MTAAELKASAIDLLSFNQLFIHVNESESRGKNFHFGNSFHLVFKFNKYSFNDICRFADENNLHRCNISNH